MPFVTVTVRVRRQAPHARRLASGQHLLRSPLADELAASAGIAGGDLVVEIGAGTGRLTAPLAERAGHVIAIEVDPRLARLLRRQVPR